MLITDVRLVIESPIFDAAPLIEGEGFSPSIACPPGHEVIDARGRLLIPGIIDDQVCFREPPMTHQGNPFTGNRLIDDDGTRSAIFSRLRYSAH